MKIKKRWIILALLVIAVVVVVLAAREPTIESGSFLVVDIGGNYEEGRPSDALGQLLKSRTRLLGDVLRELDKASRDARLQGVIVKLTPVEFDFAKVQEIRGALQRLREAGKRVLVWVSGEGGSGNREYYLASVANKIYFSENTLMPLIGLHATYMFLGGMWENLDIDMQVEQIREYKTFGDFLSRKEMSQAHREMAQSLLDDVHTQVVTRIAQARALSVEQVQILINAPTLTPDDFLKAGLIDGIRYYDELLEEIKERPEGRVPIVSLNTYSRVKPSSVGIRPGSKIAVVHGVGGVTTGQSGWSVFGQAMGADTIVAAFEEAAQDTSIEAIVFRIDSPGGSALGADLIWRAVNNARLKKPVVVSMSGVAGSGGYYIAAGATKIVAQPATLTGSIGIVFSSPNMKGILAKLGINSETLYRGRYARLFDTSKSWSADERRQIQRILERLYGIFTAKVAAGRGLSAEEVDRVGRGRVWTGSQAKELGLVDQLGGFDTALNLAKKEANISAETDVELVFFPKPQGLVERLFERLSGVASARVKFPEGWRQYGHYLTLLSREEATPLLTMPLLVQLR